jgi:release factor glutamine methyltransferase
VDARTAAVADRLRAAGCLAPDEEAADLVAGAPDPGVLEDRVIRREAGEPLAWITGRTVFCGRSLVVDPGVYVPRPHTEELVRRAAALVGSGRLADLCTGSGAVAASLRASVPAAGAVGVDLDGRAVACARRNGVPAVQADLGAPLASRSFDVVTAVAPYVPSADLAFLPRDVLEYEPLGALEGGADGLDVVREVVACAARLLRPGGWVLVELGGRQDEALRPVLEDCRFAEVATWDDGEGDLRGLMARLR